MKIHRLLLENFRGVDRREIDLPSAGVVVLAGANEVGKSSMIEALDLLLGERDSSTKAAVRAVQPVGSDVGSVVEAELTLGPHRLIYRKQWNRSGATHLEVLTPVREQLTGRPAHERVTALLEQFLDADLYRAQRVLQSEGIGWTAASALTSALDEAAGRASVDESAASLIDAVETEFRLFHTATGRATGALRELTQRRDAALAQVASAREAIAEVEQRAVEHAELVQQLVEADADLTQQQAEAARLQAKQELTDRLSAQGQLVSDAAVGARRNRDQAARLRQDREAAVAAIDLLTAELAELEEQIVARRAAVDPAEQSLALATHAAVAAEREAIRTTDQAGLAQQHADRQTDLAEYRRLDQLVEHIAAAESAALEAAAAVDRDPLSPAELRRLEDADIAVTVAINAAEAAAARVEIRPARPDREILVDGEPSAGALLRSVLETVEVELVGTATIVISPAAGAAELRRRVESATAALDELLKAAGVADLAAARTAGDRHRAAAQSRQLADRRLADLVGDHTLPALQQRRDSMGEQLFGDGSTDDGAPVDPGESRRIARSARQDADRAVEVGRAAAAAVNEADRRLRRAQQDLAQAESAARLTDQQLTVRQRQLAERRADSPDAEVAARLLQAQHDLDAAEEAKGRIVAECRELLDPDLEASVAAAGRRVQTGLARRDDTDRTLTRLTAELEVMGEQGRQDLLDVAESALAAVTAELAAVTSRASAVALLRTVLQRHREASKARYVAPFQAALVRLGRVWLGPSFDVEIDDDLQLRSRSLNGTTVPVTMLSTGAAEQLAVLVRLATAAVVGGAAGVPVVFDDALGFTDPDRLAAMGPLFGALPDTQVLLLTCDPERYRAVPDATVLAIGSDSVTDCSTDVVADPSDLAEVPGNLGPAPRSRRRRRPTLPAELSLFDPDPDDDSQWTMLLHPVRSAVEDRTA